MDFKEKGIYFIFDPLSWNVSPWEESIRGLFPYLLAVQLRSPAMDLKQISETAKKLVKILSASGLPLIVNNYPRVAAEAGAGGVHLGKKDMPLREAKFVFNGFIGASRHTVKGAREAESAGASYIGAGPVFHTSTKNTRRSPIGLKGFEKIKEAANIPVIPVGGIKEQNCGLLKGRTNAVAVSSAINTSYSPDQAARRIYGRI
ncbi:MAG: thiamine phosphate synthase [Elusimicrobiota bacterium]